MKIEIEMNQGAAIATGVAVAGIVAGVIVYLLIQYNSLPWKEGYTQQMAIGSNYPIWTKTK